MLNDNGSKLLALDVDDVLVHISTPWIERLMLRPQLAFALPKLMGRTASDGLQDEVIARQHPHIQQWLQAHHDLPAGLLGQVDLTYRGDPNFYDDLPPTTFCKGIAAIMDLPGRISHIHIVTHNFSNSDPSVASKERWLRKQLGGPERVTIHNLEAGQKKSEILQKFCPEPNAFADDSMKNVIDMLLNDAVRPHEILIPRMGHNELIPEIQQLAFLRRISINYYENVV
jgi:hypothetical protein